MAGISPLYRGHSSLIGAASAEGPGSVDEDATAGVPPDAGAVPGDGGCTSGRAGEVGTVADGRGSTSRAGAGIFGGPPGEGIGPSGGSANDNRSPVIIT